MLKCLLMAEIPTDPDSQPPEPTLDPYLRLKAILSKDCKIETKGIEEWNLVDICRGQNNQLIHELTWVGIAQEDSFVSEVRVAKHHDRAELVAILLDLLARNRFKPTHGLELHYDFHAIESECGIRISNAYWTMRQPFSEYWQGQYKPDASRLALLKRIIEEEKQKQDKWPLEGRAWQWIERYFDGCCPQEVEMPEDQNPEEVLKIFDSDIEIVRQLPLNEHDRKEIERVLKLDFIGGKYPIIVGREDPDSEEEMQRVLEEMALAPREAFGQMDHRAIAITMVLQRYRNYVAQELDFAEEEEKRREEMSVQDAIHYKDVERRQREYDTESAFLRSLSLPEWEGDDWPETLLRIANGPYFKVNPVYREQVHAYVRWFIEHMPWENENASDDPWGPLTRMLKSYWMGDYHPDKLRWNILQEECAELPPGISHSPDGRPASTYFMHKKYIHGCTQPCAKINAKQDPELLQIAYDNDMRLIRSLGLSDEVLRKTEWAYNKYLLDGNLPLTADREMPEDREDLARKLKEHLEDMKGTEWEANPTWILQAFCDHWHPISRRPAPRKE